MKMKMRFTIIITILMLLHYSIIHLQAYDPVDRFTISCGSAGVSTDGERTWTGDTDSNFLLSPEATVVAAATARYGSDPFDTARISTSEFTYTFPVSPGPKFLRLFFFPAQYSHFPRAGASFTVKSGEFTLLRYFNASLNADAAGKAVINREYIINVKQNQTLNLTFINPTESQYAFVNGIEVLSMPSDLYYTSATDPQYPAVVTGGSYSLGTNTALETAHRINIGGLEITAGKDTTGLLRKWNGSDEVYLITRGARDSLTGDAYNIINIMVNPDYIAPVEVYRIGREMGINGMLNKMQNLTWEFPVDAGFYYLLRLHFCELNPLINQIRDRVFLIYIMGQLAEERADVMKWSGNKREVGVHRDYIVLIQKNDNDHKFVNLSVQLHAYTDKRDTKYSDPFLNALEIFKISDPWSNNLAGPNPGPVQSPPDPPNQNQNEKNISGILAGVVTSVVFILLAVLAISRKRRRKGMHPRHLIIGEKSIKLLDELLLFDFTKLANATNNFHLANMLGKGGFGPVYKGKLEDGQEIAVKRLSKASGQGLEEFMNEVVVISKLQHRNLIRLLGCCIEQDEQMLVYEFMPNKSLDAFLFDPLKRKALDWRKRFNIIEGIARGILYFHRDSRLRIIHRDLKANNILLDTDMNPKISDFGLARIFRDGDDDEANTRRVVGTYGYMPPEYAMEGLLSNKLDVYSFGVLLLEIVSGRRNTSFYNNEESLSLVGFAWKLWNEGNIISIVDQEIWDPTFECSMRRCIHIGLLCLQELSKERPTMSTVILMLISEITHLPPPKKVAFVQKHNYQSSKPSPKSQTNWSNNVTLSEIQGR